MYKKMRWIIIALICSSNLNAGVFGEAGYGYNYYQYTEPNLMKIKGSLQNIWAKLGYMWASRGIEVNFNTTLGDSNTKYYGATIGDNIPINNIPQDDKFWSAEILYGSNLAYYYDGRDGFVYFGFGYRSLVNKSNPTIINIYGLPRPLGLSGHRCDQIYYYLPAGFYGKESLGVKNLYARYGLEGRWVFYGTNRTQRLAMDNVTVTSDHRFKQKNGWGVKAKLGIDYKIANAVDMFIQLNVDYWNIPDSNLVYDAQAGGYWVEPKNWTIQTGLEVGFGF